MVEWGESGAVVREQRVAEDTGNVDGSDVFASIADQLQRTTANGHEMPRGVDRTRTGTARRLVVPGRDVTVTDVDGNTRYGISSPTDLPAGEFRLASREISSITDSNESPTVYFRFAGPASVAPEDEFIVVSFRDWTMVTVGYESITMSELTPTSPPGQMTVEPTVDGVARAITHLSAAHLTSGPNRSHPEFRTHPPLVQLGDHTEIPATIRQRTPGPAIEFHLPSTLDALYVAAPLAYYLGARVRIDDEAPPRLTGTQSSLDYQFDPLPTFQHQCAQLLRRVFFLDCQVRRVDSGREQSAQWLRTQLGIDPDVVRTYDPAHRLTRYLDVPFHELDAELPDWHLSTYVCPEMRCVRSLPYLLDRLSLAYLPEASAMEPSTLLERTLTDAYQTRGESMAGRVVQPALQAGHVHAWLAPGTPIDAFKTSTRAFENQFEYESSDHERLRVTVVLNHGAMDDGQRTVADIYRERGYHVPFEVEVRYQLASDELAAVFEATNDLVHYIGHCDDAGLRCQDGNLDVAELDTSRTRTFFLNACGSHEQGSGLIEQGSVAGAVTLRTVLDRQARRVDTAFARLLVHGFSFERALTLARRRILMGKDYATVGDGTYSLLPGPKQPVVVRVEEAPCGGYNFSWEIVDARRNGARYRLPFEDVPALNGSQLDRRLSADELRSVLAGQSIPVIYQGDLRWSEDVADRL